MKDAKLSFLVFKIIQKWVLQILAKCAILSIGRGNMKYIISTDEKDRIELDDTNITVSNGCVSINVSNRTIHGTSIKSILESIINKKYAYRIIACEDIKDAHGNVIVKKGEKGGYVSSNKNLSQKGSCWIYGDAQVLGDAKVLGDAQVRDNAKVINGSIVADNAEVYDDATVFNSSVVAGNAQVYGRAQVFNDAKVLDNAQVYDNARVFNSSIVAGNAEVYDHAQVFNSAQVLDNAEVYRNGQVFNSTIVRGNDEVRERITFNNYMDEIIR